MQVVPYQVVTDIALDDNGDWLIQNGDLQLIGDDPGIIQSVTIALKFALGEWFLNLAAGVPYYQNVFVKNPDPNLLKSIFTDTILAVPGITAMVSLDLTIDPSTRTLFLDWQATSALSGLTVGNSTTQAFPGATS
jgi:hypothetical protein